LRPHSRLEQFPASKDVDLERTSSKLERRKEKEILVWHK
jgi:hypothetical protein